MRGKRVGGEAGRATADDAETFRILCLGGSVGISYVVADDHLTPAERAERGSCVSW